jgi:hypothetical protein
LTPFILLAVAFVVPFVNVRRPLSVVHADILVLVLSPFYFLRYMDQSAGSLRWAVLSAAAGLVYLVVRLAFLAARPAAPHQALVSVVPVPVLAIAVAALLAIQLSFPLYDYRPVIDVGYSSVAGAEHILKGQDVYGGSYEHPELHPDAYGPFNYLVYVPFAYLFSDAGDAARAAASVLDVLTALGLFVVGRRLLPGRAGMRLGATLSYAWCAYPYTFFATVYGYNDALVALSLVGAMVLLASPARGAALGLGAAAKFVPLAAFPLFATARGERSIGSLLRYALFFTVAVVAVFAPLIPDGGLTELYRRTIGWQLHRDSVSSIWGQYPSLESLQEVVRAAAVLFAIVIAAVPRRRTPAQVAALGGAAIIAFELSLSHWLPSYVIWFAPLALVAVFANGRRERADASNGEPAAALERR